MKIMKIIKMKKQKQKKKIKEKKIKSFKISEDNDDDDVNSNICGFNKIQNIKETNNNNNNSFSSSLPSSYDKFILHHIDFKLFENEKLNKYIYYNDIIKDNNINLIDGLKLIHKIYYNKYNTYKFPDKLRYFVLFDEKGGVIIIIDSFKNVIIFRILKIRN
jgi:hypothetical protein